MPIILNVKNFDLFFIDRLNRKYNKDKHAADWRALGIDDPQPFEKATFYAPQMPGGSIAVPTSRDEVQPYSWSLSDVIERGLFSYLFAEDDTSNENFSALLLDLEDSLTEEKIEADGTSRRSLKRNDGQRQTFQELLDWVGNKDNRLLDHAAGTWSKLRRRLRKLVLEGNGVLRRYDPKGHPLDLVAAETKVWYIWLRSTN